MGLNIPPGATPILDLSELKIAITTQKELDAAEFDNIHRAEQFYFRKRKIKDLSWFTPTYLNQIHKAMFGDVWEWAGKYRKTPILPIGLEPYKIPTAIFELCQDVTYWTTHLSDMSLIEMGARIHHRIAWIHPFPNGNGRFSRFVSNLFLFSFRHPLHIWPIGMEKDNKSRRTYLEKLKEADQGNFSCFVNYLKSLNAAN